jgi:3-methylcrotonyl-CoA carboxylase alpha subunit
MHGKVLAVMVKPGDRVTKGQRLAIVEAMKMEHSLTAPNAGRIGEIAISVGSQVAEGAKLMTIQPTEDAN